MGPDYKLYTMPAEDWMNNERHHEVSGRAANRSLPAYSEPSAGKRAESSAVEHEAQRIIGQLPSEVWRNDGHDNGTTFSPGASDRVGETTRAGGTRQFASGATRNDDTGKHDPEGFLSPLVIEGFNAYMHEHRVQPDGALRDSDNWQKGIPIPAYRKSLVRHVFTAWNLWRGWPVKPEQVGTQMRLPTLKGTLYAILFNVQGYLHELEKAELTKASKPMLGGMMRSRIIDDSAGVEL